MSPKRPWLVAVWPGMGHVALSAGYYLLAKLGMHELAEFAPREFFDVEHVEVKSGLIRPGALPRSRLYLAPHHGEGHDLVLFLGEAQPPTGRYAFCRLLLEQALEHGVERVITFAAMATAMHPRREPRVFAAATDEEGLSELGHHELEILEDGHIGGLNGVVLGAAAEAGLPGCCLLGEMPHLFTQLPFPKASLAVLRVFARMADLDLDLTELAEQAATVERQLGGILARVERAVEARQTTDEAETYTPETEDEEGLAPADAALLERLFEEAAHDRAKAYELKRELDRLDVFRDHEDRFLDLFRRPGDSAA